MLDYAVGQIENLFGAKILKKENLRLADFVAATLAFLGLDTCFMVTWWWGDVPKRCYRGK
jgi:hypothetical protein